MYTDPQRNLGLDYCQFFTLMKTFSKIYRGM